MTPPYKINVKNTRLIRTGFYNLNYFISFLFEQIL